MRLPKRSAWTFFAGIATLYAPPLSAANVAQMNLEQLVQHSERVFVGTVLSVSERRVEVGGGQVPAVTYRLQVDEAFKGEFTEIKGQRFTEVSMLGSLKIVAGARHPIRNFPVLREGREYLLLVAPAGPIGLTSTMGLGQGCFNLSHKGREKVALNEANNHGLFSGMNVALPSGKAVPYAALADLIRTIVGGAPQ